MLSRIYNGAFASANPRCVVLAGAGRLRAADPDGLIVSRFGWADQYTGYAANERTAAHQLLGFVLPVIASWQRVRVELGHVAIRPGLEVTLASRGDFFLQFPNGAYHGQRVYALADGTPAAGIPAEPYEATPWTVQIGCEPGGLAVISTWSNFV